MNTRSLKDFQGSGTILYDTVIVDTHHYNMLKPTECTTPRVNPNINHGLWVPMMCQIQINQL